MIITITGTVEQFAFAAYVRRRLNRERLHARGVHRRNGRIVRPKRAPPWNLTIFPNHFRFGK